MELCKLAAKIGNPLYQMLDLITSCLQSDEVLLCGFSTSLGELFDGPIELGYLLIECFGAFREGVGTQLKLKLE